MNRRDPSFLMETLSELREGLGILADFAITTDSTSKCDHAIDEPSLIGIIQETLQDGPSHRPSAANLFTSFSRCYDLANTDQARSSDLPQISNFTSTLDASHED